MAQPSFAADIRPLFRQFDSRTMGPIGLDLTSYDAVKGRAAEIYARLRDKSMPCDAPWTADKLKTFKDWMDGGRLP